MGYIGAMGRHDADAFRQAVIAGTVIASFTVEGFGLERLAHLTVDEIALRFDEFDELTAFNRDARLPLRELQSAI